MYVIVAVAIFGALLGLSTRPAIRAVLVGAASVAAFQSVAIWASRLMLRKSGMEDLALSIQGYAGSDARDLIPTVSAVVFAAALVSFMRAAPQSAGRSRRARRVALFED